MESRFLNWLQVLGNIGIFAGLILVAVQINQAADQNRQNVYQEQAYQQLGAEFALMGDEGMAVYARTMLDPSSATEADILTVWSYNAGAFVPAYVTWEAWRLGQVTDEDWRKQRDAVAYALDHPLSRAIWQQARKQFDPAFAKEIDGALDLRRQHGAPDLPTMVRSIQQGLRASATGPANAAGPPN